MRSQQITFPLLARKTSLPIMRAISVFMLAAAIPTGAFAQEQKPFSVQAKWKLGGSGGWDYLVADSSAHRLYITHGERVEVIDSGNGKRVGAIVGLKGTHGVALDDGGQFGYISDGGANAVVVFDRHSLKTVASIPAGTNPDAILYEPVTKTVWAFNGRSNNATVIDAETRKVLATIALPGKPEFAVADGKGMIFNNIEDKSQIAQIDAKARKVTATWPLDPCKSPSGLAIDPDGRRFFAVCDENTMAVIDANSGKVIATPLIGDGPDAAAYDARNKLAFSSNGKGTLTVIDTSNNQYKVLQNVPTQPGARTMALDQASGVVYLVSAKSGPRPAPTAQDPHPWPTIVPDTFTVLVVTRDKFVAGAWPSVDIVE